MLRLLLIDTQPPLLDALVGGLQQAGVDLNVVTVDSPSLPPALQAQPFMVFEARRTGGPASARHTDMRPASVAWVICTAEPAVDPSAEQAATLRLDRGPAQQLDQAWRLLAQHARNLLLSPDAPSAAREAALACHDAASAFIRQNGPPPSCAGLPPAPAMYRALFDHSMDMIFLTTTDGRILAANATACRSLMLTEEEIVAAGRARLVDTQDPRLVALLTQRAATGSARGELTYIRGNGTRFPGETTSRVFVDEDGMAYTCLIVRDMSQQRDAEQALRDSAQHTHDLLHHLPAGVVVHGPDTAILDSNPMASSLLGLDPQQLTGKKSIDPAWSFVRADGTPLPMAEYPVNRVAASGQAIQGQVLGVSRPDRDTPLWVLCNAYPVFNAAGGGMRIVVMFIDISGLRQAEALLRESEARLQLVLRGSNDAAWEWDFQRQAMFYSSRWLDMVGHAQEALSTDAMLWRRLLHPDDETRLDQFIADLVASPRESFEVEFRLRHAQGHFVHVLARGFLLRDAQGKPLRMAGLNTDLTQRKHAEAERRALESQLRESQKMETVGTLAGGIAHDFNNILASILGNAALACETLAPTDPALPLITQIQKAGSRARSLVQQILSFSRRQPQVLQQQALQHVVEETVALLRATLPANVTLDVALCDETLRVSADATQLQQVLVNLCTNAWHSLHGSTGRIGLVLDAVDLDAAAAARLSGLAAGRHARIAVTDNGSGMDAATRERIFEPFFTTKPVGLGTGLGLSVVHGIVTAHAGVISVDTAPGRGSRFELYLPLVEAAMAADPPDAETLPQRAGNGQHVLYVDDDDVMLLMTERLLLRCGYRVTCFSSARQAIHAIQAQPDAFDLVVTDYNMPDLSGLDVASEVARVRPDLPVVISSGYISDELRSKAAQAGVRRLLPKQNTLEELATMVHELLTAAPMAVQTRPVPT